MELLPFDHSSSVDVDDIDAALLHYHIKPFLSYNNPMIVDWTKLMSNIKQVAYLGILNAPDETISRTQIEQLPHRKHLVSIPINQQKQMILEDLQLVSFCITKLQVISMSKERQIVELLQSIGFYISRIYHISLSLLFMARDLVEPQRHSHRVPISKDICESTLRLCGLILSVLQLYKDISRIFRDLGFVYEDDYRGLPTSDHTFVILIPKDPRSLALENVINLLKIQSMFV